MRSGSSYLSQSEKIVSFGLGQNTGVDSLFVKWPSGQTDVFSDLKGNQEIKVIEGTNHYEAIMVAGIKNSKAVMQKKLTLDLLI